MRYTLLCSLLFVAAQAGPACVHQPKDSCFTSHGDGKCMDTTSCQGLSVPGYCRGASSIQCCIERHPSISMAESSSKQATSEAKTAESKANVLSTSTPTTMETMTTSVQGAHTRKETSTKVETTHSDKKPITSSTHRATTTSHKAAATTSAAAKASDGGGHVNEEGLQLIEEEEGWRANYYNINGDKTVGYGHDCTQKQDCNGLHVPLSRADGERLLKSDVDGFEKCVCQLSHASELSIYQFGALVSFAYNSGCGGLDDYFSGYMERKDFSGICEALPSTNTLGGELSSRRAKEGAFCKTSSSETSGC